MVVWNALLIGLFFIIKRMNDFYSNQNVPKNQNILTFRNILVSLHS